MTESDADDQDDQPRSESSDGRAERLSPAACHETVDPATRETVLEEYAHRCQTCGRHGPATGGLATLHVHHIERDPAGMDEHDLENLTLLCRSCHSWYHQQSTPDDAPVEITEEDQSVLLPQDIEILRYLAESGPQRTGEIVAGLTADLSVSAVRERLWVLMGLDNLVESRDRQVVDKDVETGEWGLTEHVETSARGHIPDDAHLLLQRMEDEQVRQALNRGCDRQHVMAVLDMSRRTTFNKSKRAHAYDFPLEAFSRGGRPTDDSQSTPDVSPSDAETSEGEDGQQRLDSIANPGAESRGRTETWGTPEADSTTPAPVASEDDSDDSRDDVRDIEELRAQVEEVFTALQELENAQ